VRFNHDILSSALDTVNALAPSLLTTDVYRNDDSSAGVFEVYTPNSNTTFTGGAQQCEQKWYDCMMSPDVCSVKVHVHLGVAINSLGDNTVEMWVPVGCGEQAIQQVQSSSADASEHLLAANAEYNGDNGNSYNTVPLVCLSRATLISVWLQILLRRRCRFVSTTLSKRLACRAWIG